MLPAWLAKDYSDAPARKQKVIAYYRQRHIATPAWVDHKAMAKVYAAAARRRRGGEKVVVDHQVPLKHKHVCGLHCEANLAVVYEEENQGKSNHHWPDMWAEQLELPIELSRHRQYELPLSLHA